MRIPELKAREDFEKIFRASIESLFSSFEPDIRICDTPDLEFQKWYYHPFYGVFVQRGFCYQGRRFLDDSMRHTPKFIRKLPQCILSHALHYRRSFDLLLEPAFSLNGGIADAQAAMILPGNQRIRLFRFNQNSCRVHVKSGFSDDALLSEIRFRQLLASKFDSIMPITHVGENHRYFDEELISFFPLNRYESRKIPRKLLIQMSEEIFQISKTDEDEVEAIEYIHGLLQSLGEGLKKLQNRWPVLFTDHLERIWKCLASHAEKLPCVPLGLSHGDFQAGNILVSRNRRCFRFIDWEDVKQRFAPYDAICMILGSRTAAGIEKRVQSFLSKGSQSPFWAPWRGFSKPKAILSLFVLEEWNWLLHVSQRVGISNPPLGLLQKLEEISKINKLLERAD